MQKAGNGSKATRHARGAPEPWFDTAAIGEQAHAGMAMEGVRIKG